MRVRSDVQPVAPDDGPALVDVWEASVRATHQFVSDADLQLFKTLVRGDLIKLPKLACVRDGRGAMVGFVGVSGQKLEALFVHPFWHREGVGRALVAHAVGPFGATIVDVNEQNEGAVRFYERMGFRRFGRSPVDGMGKPYPLLHMRLRTDQQEEQR